MSHLKRAFVCGFPIKHSRSPLVHGHWLKHYNLEGSYEKVEVAPKDLQALTDEIRSGKYVGGNFTQPHKEEILEFLDEIDSTAKSIGAVNTVWSEGNKLMGTNTDAYGFSANLDQLAPEWKQNAKSKTALILGAGGASRAVLQAILQADYNTILLANRTTEKAEKLAKEFSNKIIPTSLEDIQQELIGTDLLVNTTSLGMNKNDAYPFTMEGLKSSAIVTDIVYTPLKTKLIKQAKKNGNKTVDGLGMLLHQAVPGFEKWFGVRPQVTQELRNLIESDL